MSSKYIAGFFVAMFLSFQLSAQFTDRYWVFGDSAGIDFSNLSNPVAGNSILRSRGSCASICDSLNNLLFYVSDPQIPPWPSGSGGLKYGYVVNNNHQLMDNGDKLIGENWYQEFVIVPDPNNVYRFYIFSAGVLPPVNGLYYSVVDLTYNGGLGKVVQKNIQLSADTLSDGITAIKHGNGRDWWVITKNWSYAPTYRNDFQITLITPIGAFLHSNINIGSLSTNASFTRLKFNSEGTRLYSVANQGIIDRFDFDRCTGILSNFQNLEPFGSIYTNYWGFEISPDESKIYTTSIYNTLNQDSSFLFQFDLNASNFLGSVDTLATISLPDIPGLLQKGPDNKIYLSVTSQIVDTCFDYLYCYGSVNTTNSNLSVINFPDSSSIACDFQPYSFYLGGHKAYWGLPNNPNYELGRWVGSPCDTLTVGITETIGYKNNITVYYDINWQMAFINAKGLRGKKFTFELYNINGQLIQMQQGVLDGEYYTNNLSMGGFADGIYVVRLKTDKEVLTGKFVKR
jgi:hypothetical protein